MVIPKISIIVPVYNVDSYLPQCLDSILAQTFTDWEAILVDDGSTDRSGVICDEYAKQDSRIRVIHRENAGVSSARNAGMAIALGEYLYFTDADDELLPDCLTILHSNMGDDVDLVTASYQRYHDGEFIPDVHSRAGGLFSVKDYLETISTLPNAHFCERYCVTKLFRKSIIEDNNLRFDSRFAYREDVLFLYSYVVCCSCGVVGVNKPVYNYYRRTSGAAVSHTKGLTPHSSDIFFAIERCFILVRNSGLSKAAEERLKREMIEAYTHYRKLLRGVGEKKYKQVVRKMDKSLYSVLSKKVFYKMKTKNFLRPAYHWLQARLNRSL